MYATYEMLQRQKVFESLWNEEAPGWLKTLGFRRTFKAEAITDGKKED